MIIFEVLRFCPSKLRYVAFNYYHIYKFFLTSSLLLTFNKAIPLQFLLT